MSNKHHAILSKQLSQVEDLFNLKDHKNNDISKASVGWHLDHVLKVFNTVSEWVIKSNPEDYKWQFNFWRSLLFPLGYFPRGKGKSPKQVLPPEIITIESLQQQLQVAKQSLNNFKPLHEKAFFKHFIFGMLHKQQTLRFLYMHTNHHLKIVNDILKQ